MAFGGLLELLQHKQYMSLFLPIFIIIIGSLALVFVMHGETRFKDSLMPYIFMLAAAFINKYIDFVLCKK